MADTLFASNIQDYNKTTQVHSPFAYIGGWFPACLALVENVTYSEKRIGRNRQSTDLCFILKNQFSYNT